MRLSSLLTVPSVHNAVYLRLKLRSSITQGPPIVRSTIRRMETSASVEQQTRTPQGDSERKWNRLSEHMSYFHDHFKLEFNTLYELADGSFTKRGMSLKMYLRMADELIHHLTLHHTIEERFIFPVLAKRMPSFSMENDAVHIESHKGIHHGLDALTAIVNNYKKDPSTYKPEEMRTCLDSWRQVLFTHLDDEVNDLRGENMKKYWKLEELEQIPM